MSEENDLMRDLLNHIYITGGYTSVYNVMKYLDAPRKTCWHNLELLSQGSTKERYLKKVNASTRSSRDKMIYQVTRKTCALFNNPDSYFRKKHKKEYIARSLLKNRYFSVNKNLKTNIIFSHDDKLEYIYEIGFKQEMLPRKYIGKDYIYTIEDSLLIDDDDNITVIYFDKESVTVKRQVTTLFSNYSRMIASKTRPIFIRVITTNKFREHEFIKEMRKYNRQLYSKEDINDMLLQLYVSFLKSSTEKSGGDVSIIIQNYKNGIIKNAILDSLKKDKDDISTTDTKCIREVSKEGLNGIIGTVKSMMDTKEKDEYIKEYFTNLFRLNYHDYLIFQGKNCIYSVEILSAKLM